MSPEPERIPRGAYFDFKGSLTLTKEYQKYADKQAKGAVKVLHGDGGWIINGRLATTTREAWPIIKEEIAKALQARDESRFVSEIEELKRQLAVAVSALVTYRKAFDGYPVGKIAEKALQEMGSSHRCQDFDPYHGEVHCRHCGLRKEEHK